MPKHVGFIALCLTMIVSGCSASNHVQEKRTAIKLQQIPDQQRLQDAFKSSEGTMVIIDAHSEKRIIYNDSLASEQRPPCSTFKIWNSLIGLELSLVTSADESFYLWDGKKRFLDAWYKDLTFKEAFQSSCVPAFQQLATKIGPERMQEWLNKIHYGNRDISSGIDVFWLPEKDRKTILISPIEQALQVKKLINGKLPFSEKSKSVLKDVMQVKEGKNGVLYGKTGSGMNEEGVFTLGWFVGYVESGGNVFTFACLTQGENANGLRARKIVTEIFTNQGLL